MGGGLLTYFALPLEMMLDPHFIDCLVDGTHHQNPVKEILSCWVQAPYTKQAPAQRKGFFFFSKKIYVYNWKKYTFLKKIFFY